MKLPRVAWPIWLLLVVLAYYLGRWNERALVTDCEYESSGPVRRDT